MSDLEYSDDALNSMGAFYRAKAIVYVEGDDDVMFWKHVLSAINVRLEIEPVGGKSQIERYAQKIISGEIDAVVARDADLTHFVGPQIKHPRILYSYGYSIENSLYTNSTIKTLSESWSKTDRVGLDTCVAWWDELLTALTPLIELDVANALAKTGVETIGDNCTRFMLSRSSHLPCPDRIGAHVSALKATIAEAPVEAAKEIINNDAEVKSRLLRGHFLATAIMKFIVKIASKYGKKISLSSESLYAAAIVHFENAVRTMRHQHYEYYKSIVSGLELTLR